MIQCPACDQDIVAEVALELHPDEGWNGGKEMALQGNVLGMRIQHDCIPQQTRAMSGSPVSAIERRRPVKDTPQA